MLRNTIVCNHLATIEDYGVQLYIHRSGRTARASRSGLSVLLVDQTEATFYRRICQNLNRCECVESTWWFGVEGRAEM